MNKKIYIASGLKNFRRVLELRDKLAEYGIWLTYDWAGDIQKHLENSAKSDMPFIEFLKNMPEDLGEIARLEHQAVLDCHLLLFITPAGRGSHFELGLAYGAHKPIILLGEKNDPIAFYSLPGIESHSDENKAIRRIVELVG
jgi:hypothetical protein